MTSDLMLLWVVQLAPVIAFLTIQCLPGRLKKLSPFIGVSLATLAALGSLRLLCVYTAPREFIHHWLTVADGRLWSYLPINSYQLAVGFLLDPLNLLMVNLVTWIALAVQVFSFYYMKDDPSRSRYFAFLSFFSFSMTGLVLSNNFLQTFIFWELVGLTSYLLIGFWYEKNEAATAARKAFVMNRLGDLGFYLGIILLFLFTGTVSFSSLSEILKADNGLTSGFLTLIGILIFMGVMGKSSQFPFHVWLPDAMQGPTPVSALIHSATMVAAGVFLLARSFGVFAASETTLLVVLVIGTLTAVLGAILATGQWDIKKVLAYSTMSQLGLMVMAIGAGSPSAGMFHLSTHAFFKSLLFLTAGVFIHEYHTNDIWEIGQKGGRKNLLAVAALCVGLFSLSGLFPFSGFFSKDMLLETLKEKNIYFYYMALFVSFLTAYYSFRLLFILLFSKINYADEHAHEKDVLSSLCQKAPLIFLGAVSLYSGALGTKLFDYKILTWLGSHAGHLNQEIMLTSTFLILGGAGLAFMQFRNPEKALQAFKSGRSPLKTAIERNFFIDDAYYFLTHEIGLKLGALFDWFDRTVINGLMVNETAYGIKRLGKRVARLQSGWLQDYLFVALGLGVIFVFYLVGS